SESGYRGFRSAVNRSRHLNLNDVVLGGIDHQIANGMQAELAHDVAAMSFHGLGAQVQQRGHFLGTLALCEKLSDLPLPGCKGGEIRRLISGDDMTPVQESCQDQVVDAGSEEH